MAKDKKKQSTLSRSVSYMDIASVPFGARQKMLSGGLGDEIKHALTAGQMASLFPNYYKENLNSYAGQKSQFTAGGGPSAPASGYTPAHTGTGTYAPPPGAPPSATPAPKTGLTPSEMRRIEANPYLAGYGDRLPKQGDAQVGTGNVTLAGTREKPTDSSAYYDRMYKSLYKAAVDKGVPNPEVIARLGAAQTALETGHGKHMVGNNAFGIKADQDGTSGQAAMTQEFENGKMVTKSQRFRTYASPEDSAGDYIDFLKNNKRYAALFSAQSVEEAIAIQGTTSYASDPNYSSKLASINTSLGTNAPKAVLEQATPVNDKPAQGAGQLAAVEVKGATPGQDAAQRAAEQGGVPPQGTTPDHYTSLRASASTKIGKDDPIWASVDPSLRNNMTMLLDRDTGLVNRDTLLAADAQAKVLRKNGFEPNPVSGGDNHSENHGAGRDANYAIDMAALRKDPDSGKMIPVHMGREMPYEIKRDMAIAASLSGEGSGQNFRLGFPTNQSDSSVHTQFDPQKEARFWGYDQRTASGAAPAGRAILETTPDGQRFLSDMAAVKQMKPEDKAALMASITGVQAGTNNGVAATTAEGEKKLASQAQTTEAENLLALANNTGSAANPSPSASPVANTAPVAPAPQTAQANNSAPTVVQANNSAPTMQSSQSLAAVENPDASTVPTLAMASGGMISEPHTAINDRTGAITKLGEKGTGGEAVIPMNKVNAAELGQQPYQMPQPPAPEKEPVIQQVMMPSALPGKQEEPTNNYSSEPPEQGATLGKAYARARMASYTPSNDYVSFGHPVV